MVGWILLGCVSIFVFLTLCLRHSCSSLGYQQEAYWSYFRAQEDKVLQRTMDAHAQVQAIRNVGSFFGFVALTNDEKELLEEARDAKGGIPSLEWNRITGVSLFRENRGGNPLYSRLHKWSTYTQHNNIEEMDKDMI